MYERPVPSKLPDVGVTIFTVMSRLAQDCGAINLSQGFPEFDAPAALREAVMRHVGGGNNQYAPMTGLPELREQVAAKVALLYGREVSPETEVTITHGATEAIFAAIQALIGPGDEAVVFDPAYDSYEPAVTLAGGLTRHVALQAPEFTIDWQALEDVLGPRTRLIIVNSPHNPTGMVLQPQDLDRLAEMARGRRLWFISDEVYEHMVFDGQRHHSFIGHPELYSRSLVISSFGKTLHATGWKVGYCVAPPPLGAELRKVHQFVCFSIVTPIQHALADFLRECPDHWRELPDFYQAKRDLFCSALQGSRYSLRPSQGTYFQLLEYSRLARQSDLAYAEWLTREHRVAAIPISLLCERPVAGRYLRFCFAKHDDTLKEAARRLCQL